MLNEIIKLILVTFIPALELRASIPLGILELGINWSTVFIICVLANIILAVVVYSLLIKFIDFFLRFKLFKKFYNRSIEKTQKKIKPAVEKYGILGIAFFIAIPLPGSGVYTGAVAAHLLGLKKREFLIASIIGVILAAISVTIITLTGKGIIKLIL